VADFELMKLTKNTIVSQPRAGTFIDQNTSIQDEVLHRTLSVVQNTNVTDLRGTRLGQGQRNVEMNLEEARWKLVSITINK
jgi:hypothetical protein